MFSFVSASIYFGKLIILETVRQLDRYQLGYYQIEF